MKRINHTRRRRRTHGYKNVRVSREERNNIINVEYDHSVKENKLLKLKYEYLDIDKPYINKKQIYEKKETSNKETEVILQIDQTENMSRTEKIKRLLKYQHLNTEQQNKIEELIEEFADCFHLKGDKLGMTTIIEHRIPTINDIPVTAKPYRFPHALKEELDRQIREMIEGDIIEPSYSNYTSPVFLVSKSPISAGNKIYRLVVDFRQLNEKTIRDKYPLPNILDIIDQVGGSKYYSTFDLAQGFFQIPLPKEDRYKTAFSTSFGLFQFKKMPMGLSYSPATFQRIIDRVFYDMQQKEIFLFLDDAVVHGKTIEEHDRKLKKFFQRLRAANLKLQPDKCKLLQQEVVHLGHLLSQEGVKPDPKKLSAVQNFPKPKNIKNIRQFLGLAGYYRRFIENFSGIAKPLSELLKTDVPFIWSEETQKAFEILKEKLCSKPVLQFFNASLPMFVTTDASNIAIGGILSQGELGQDRPIGYVSRVLTDKGGRYCVYEKEALAIVYTVTQFRPYLLGRKFTIITDYKPLLWFKNRPEELKPFIIGKI